MITFTEYIKKGANFTPGDLIRKHCKKHGIPYNTTQFFTGFATVNGRDYTYDHYTITPEADREKITIYLHLM